jgi:hypothetical protein
LEELAGAVAHDPVAGRVAAGTTKAAGPARRLERLLALRISAIVDARFTVMVDGVSA